MGARQELALLVGVAVHGVVEEIGADAAIIEQRVALARRAVAGDRLAFPPSLIRNSRILRLVSLTCSPKSRTSRARSMPSASFRGFDCLATAAVTGLVASSA